MYENGVEIRKEVRVDIVLRRTERRAKRANGHFSLEDLPEYLRDKAAPGAKVFALRNCSWVKVGKWQLLLRAVITDIDGAWIKVLVSPCRPLLDWLLLPLAKLSGRAVEVPAWRLIPGTNLLMDTWYVGDGDGGTALVFEAKMEE